MEGLIQLEVCKECEFGSLLEFGEILFYDMFDFALVRVEELVFGMMFSVPMDCQSLYFLVCWGVSLECAISSSTTRLGRRSL